MTSRRERTKASIIAPGEDVLSSSNAIATTSSPAAASPSSSSAAVANNNTTVSPGVDNNNAGTTNAPQQQSSSSAAGGTTPQQQHHHSSSVGSSNMLMASSFFGGGAAARSDHHHQSTPATTSGGNASYYANNSNQMMNEDYMRRRSLDLDEKRSKEWLEYQRLYRQETSSHPKVFLDLIFAADGTNNSQRLVIELFSDSCPKICENFRDLCLGHGGWVEVEKNNNNASAVSPSSSQQQQQQPQQQYTTVKLDFADTRCSRILPGIGALFGEIKTQPLTTYPSIAANGQGYLQDENFALRHNARGILTMVGYGPNTIGSQFMILFDRAPQFDFKYIPFGRVVEGLPVLEKLEKQNVNIVNVPTQPITIALSGALTGKKPQPVTPSQGAPFVAASGRLSSR